MMTPEERGWVAGLLEGEGHFRAQLVKGRYYGQIGASSTDEDTIHQLQIFTGVGRINGPYNHASQNLAKKDFWTWHVTRNVDIRMVCSEIISLMSTRRREQIELMLSRMQTTFYNGRNLV